MRYRDLETVAAPTINVLRVWPEIVGAIVLNRPGMSGDSSSWKGWGHVRWFIEEVPAGAA
ncbi:hypothetical protein HX91_1342 [Mycobacterium tuberculosis]|nr:hypothetical protein HX91_1342 [Mycobacterium tuberculosis]